MRDLYRALAPTERARLVARLVREDDMGELRAVRDSLPDDRAAVTAYNRALHLAAHLPNYVLLCSETLLRAIEQTRTALYRAIEPRLREKRAGLHLMDLWPLVGYPVTESEYARLVAMERAELRPIHAELAHYVAEAFSADDAADVCPAVAAWLTADDGDEQSPDDGDEEPAETEALGTAWDWEPAAREVGALIDAAITAGALPAPVLLPDGQPALPWGPFTDWLHARPASAYVPYPPEHHVAAVYVLRGFLAPWDVRPDCEHAAVRRRRRDIIDALALLAGLDPEQVPPADPPTSTEEREQQMAAVEDAWPWRLTPEDLDELRAVAAMARDIRAEATALLGALEAMQREEFGGEDPLRPRYRAAVEELRATADGMAALWAGDLGPTLYGDDWPALPATDPERLQERHAAFVEMLTDV